MQSIAFHLNTLVQGGAERVVSNLANQFAREGYTVYVATEWVDQDEFPLDPRVKRVHVGLREGDENKGRITKFLLRIRYLREFLEEYQPDVLCAFAQRANYRALMAQTFVPGIGGYHGRRVPTVISIRTDPKGHYDAFSDKVQIHWLFPKAAGCVFQTTGQKEFFRPYLQDNSAIILNPINPKYIGVPRPPRQEREKAVVHHARLVDFKNQPMLCRAFLRVHERHPDYVLKIYGPDSGDGTKQILEQLIAENHAESFIRLCGGSDELEKLLPRGQVYAFSSDWEGLPNSLMEAMALGLPCVATDCPCGGPRTIMQDSVNGLLVPIRDEKAMADAICRLIENPDLADRLGENARKIGEKCSEEAIFRQWRDYLNHVLEQNS